jgi:AcrR family transcriptional regulator
MEQQPINRFERRKQRTIAALKQAGLDLVLEQGYDSVTIQEIVDRADVGRGTFYLHFDSKEDLVWQIILEGLMEANQEGDRRFSEGNFPPGYLGYLITFEHAAQNKDLYRLMMGSQGSALLTHRVAQVLADQIEASIRAGEYLPDAPQPPDLLAQMIVGALVRLVLWWLETPNRHSPQQMADMIYAVIHGQNSQTVVQ